MLAQNVIQDLIQVELDANYAIQFIKNVHHVLKQRKHVPLVQVDIMLKVEPVPRVPVKWQTAPHVHQMEVNVRNVQMDIIPMVPHVNYVIQFIRNVPHVLKQLRHVLPVQRIII